MASYRKKSYFVDDRGWSIFDIFEHVDSGQINLSRIDAGIIKAFHLHRLQEDYVICVRGKVKLIVANEDWSGVEEYVLDERNPSVVNIPKNCWHGYKGLDNGGEILYYCTRAYDGGLPDEDRAPWDKLGKEIWDVQFK